jgi:hypothetical protein
MTLHRINQERHAMETPPVRVGVTFQYHAYRLADTVVKARALQALECAASRYAVHRHVRHAARRTLEDVFDDLALNMALAPQRLDTGLLLLDGAGVFVQAQGWRKVDYCSCSFDIWADSRTRAESVQAAILRVVGDNRVREELCLINWQFSDGSGELRSVAFEEIVQEELHDEAYPMLGEPVIAFARRFLDAPETVLILQGPPGTGKTRLVRAILGEISRRKADSADVMYTSDKRVLENDEIYLDFLVGPHDVFVVEDADHLLTPRAKGNQELHRFLAIADGVVQARGRKIIFTTNLPNVGDLDEALLRPGRCFAAVRVRSLTPEEAHRLIAKLFAGDAERCAAALTRAVKPGVRGVSVADVYRACGLGA